MAIKQQKHLFNTHFITFTCAAWIPLLDITNSYEAVYSWFNILRNRYQIEVVAYVIMPNHVHLIIHFKRPGYTLSKIISNGKRFLAYVIINRLEAAGDTELLKRLANMLTEREKRKQQLHKVFMPSYDAKPILSQRFLLQKLNYIHQKPVRGKWKLARDFVTYEHSTAAFYELQLVQHFKPMHYQDIATF